MKSAYINIATASRLTGKHRDTIRAWAKANPKATRQTENGRLVLDRAELAKTYPLDAEPAPAPQEAQEAQAEPRQSKARAIDISDYKQRYIDKLEADNEALAKQNEALLAQTLDLSKQLAKITEQQQVLQMHQQQHLLEAEAKPKKPRKKHWWSR